MMKNKKLFCPLLTVGMFLFCTLFCRAEPGAASASLPEGSVPAHTVLLVDNSASVSRENREKIRELLLEAAESRQEGEQLELMVFGEEPRLLASAKEQDALPEIIRNMPFEDQNSYLPDVLAQVVQKLAGEPGASVVLVSDGGEDRSGGLPFQELYSILDVSGAKSPADRLCSRPSAGSQAEPTLCWMSRRISEPASAISGRKTAPSPGGLFRPKRLPRLKRLLRPKHRFPPLRRFRPIRLCQPRSPP